MASTENTTPIIQDPDEISLKELILKIQKWYRYLLSKWMTIVGFGILGGVLGFTYAYFKKPVYMATTTFVLESGESGTGGLGQYAGLASMVGIDLGGGGGGIFQGDNILELYKSRTMIEKTLLSEVNYQGKKQLLIDRYIEFNRLREAWAKRPELKDIHFDRLKTQDSELKAKTTTRLQDSILSIIVADINKNYLSVAKPDKKLSIIRTDVRAPDEFFAKIFNDQIVKNVNDFYVQTKTKKSLDNLAILQRKADSVRVAMNGAIYSAAEVVDATPNLNPTRQVQRTAPMQKSQFTAETNKAILGELVKNLEMTKMTLLKETPLVQVIDKPIIPLYKESISKSKMTLIGGGLLCILAMLIFTLKLFFKNLLIKE